MTRHQKVYALFLIALPWLSGTHTWIGVALRSFSRFILG